MKTNQRIFENKLNIFRKTLLVFTLTITIIPLAWSQRGGSIYLEPSGAITSRWIANQDIYGNGELPYVTSFGLYGGFRTYYFASSDIGMNYGIGYRRMGQNYEGDEKGANAKRKVTLDYIQIPMLGMFALADREYPTWFSIGPQICFLTKANQYFSREPGGESLMRPEYLPEGDTNVYQWFRPFDLMIVMEFNKMFRFSKAPRITMNYTLESGFGVLDINDEAYRIPNYRKIYGASHNMYFGFRVGIMYRAIR
ncbi:MAG TPA: outer membrane beta-barrel protein [Bacteroidales bacterium]|nr:outer membrane beta-barrel protein [Bacteroidales bacterium]